MSVNHLMDLYKHFICRAWIYISILSAVRGMADKCLLD
jgi:hypothetical protein